MLCFSILQAAGKYRQQGQTYVVEDGDIIFFKFITPNLPKTKKWLSRSLSATRMDCAVREFFFVLDRMKLEIVIDTCQVGSVLPTAHSATLSLFVFGSGEFHTVPLAKEQVH